MSNSPFLNSIRTDMRQKGYALKTEKIDLPLDVTAANIGFMINANQIGKASFTAYFGR